MKQGFFVYLFMLVWCLTLYGDDAMSQPKDPSTQDGAMEVDLDYNHFFEKSLKLQEFHSKRRIDVNTLLTMREDKNTIILDVRDKDDYDCVHIEGARNLGVGKMDGDSLAAIIPDKNTRIVIYCDNALEPYPVKMTALVHHAFPVMYEYGYHNLYELEPLSARVHKTRMLDGTSDDLMQIPFVFSAQIQKDPFDSRLSGTCVRLYRTYRDYHAEHTK